MGRRPISLLSGRAVRSLVIVGLVAVCALIWRSEQFGDYVSGSLTPADILIDEDSAIDPELSPGSEDTANSLTEVSGEFTPHSVIGNVDCKLLAGRGSASDTAIVVLPIANGARFEVLDDQGQLFGGELPFTPHHLRVGKRSDGSVLAGFGDIRRNSNEFREVDAAEPVRIYMDGQVIYESDKAWDFQVAADGSSFYALEPLAGNASRLVTRNLDLGREEHHDLGDIVSPVNGSSSDFTPKYSVGEREVMLTPAYAEAFGRGPHYFFPIDGGEVRQVQVGERGAQLIADDATPEIVLNAQSSSSAVLASSETGYFADFLQGNSESTSATYRFVRREFQHGAESGGIVEAWSRQIDLTSFYGRLSLSDSGEWLAVHARNFQVLETATGETIFEYARAGDKQAELDRLANVMEADATVADLGSIFEINFFNENLLISRRFGSVNACSGDMVQYNRCVADLRERGIYRTVVDVFDMRNVHLNSQPDFRVDYNRYSQCESGEFSLRGLQVSDGNLTFLSVRR